MARILLVEDAADLARVIARELQASGHEVEHAADGPSALARFAARPPDLVILDWMLPGLDGLQVLRRLRESSAVPVLMLTARGEEADRVLGLEVGADDYLVKPFSLRELAARVRALLRRIEHLQAVVQADRGGDRAPLHYGGLYLNPDTFEVRVNGAAVELTRTEFGLLHLLLRNPGRVFSRSYLLDTVWGENYIAGDRSVDNAILRLRKKLGPIGDAIETIWGAGYRLRSEP